jgi:hypothetical protein
MICALPCRVGIAGLAWKNKLARSKRWRRVGAAPGRPLQAEQLGLDPEPNRRQEAFGSTLLKHWRQFPNRETRLNAADVHRHASSALTERGPHAAMLTKRECIAASRSTPNASFST